VILKKIVVATSSGQAGRKVIEGFKERDIQIILVVLTQDQNTKELKNGKKINSDLRKWGLNIFKEFKLLVELKGQ